MRSRLNGRGMISNVSMGQPNHRIGSTGLCSQENCRGWAYSGTTRRSFGDSPTKSECRGSAPSGYSASTGNCWFALAVQFHSISCENVVEATAEMQGNRATARTSRMSNLGRRVDRDECAAGSASPQSCDQLVHLSSCRGCRHGFIAPSACDSRRHGKVC